MSNGYLLAVIGGGGTPEIPPEVPEQFTTDVLGPAVATGNNLNVFGGYTSVNDDDGIRTSGAGPTVTIQLTNRFNEVGTTAGAATTTIVSFVTGPDGVYTVEAQVNGFAAVGAGGSSIKMFGGFIKSGGILTALPDTDPIINNNTAASTASAEFAAGANNINITVTGVAGLNMNWRALGTYSLVI